MAQLTVKAASGLRVPMDGSPREYITDTAVVTVARTPYYLRRLAEGDLIEATEVPTVPAVAMADVPASGEDTDAKPGKKKPSTQESAS